MKKLFYTFLLLTCHLCEAQNPKDVIARVNNTFSKVKDYSADIAMNFSIPGVNIQPITGKVFYKLPDKFRVKTKGIIFLPKQNPYYSLALLKDTNAYTAISTGTEKVGPINCTVVNIIPTAENDLILGKFWIDATRGLIMRSQLTTKSNGTIVIDNAYGNSSAYGLPDKIVFTVDVTRFKVPKAVAVDINSKSTTKTSGSDKATGVITLQFSNYQLNQKLSDSVFTEKE